MDPLIVGQATVEVSPDARLFGPKTEAAITAALEGVMAKVNLELDPQHLRSTVEAAVGAATAGITANIGTDVDTSDLVAKVEAANKVAEEAANAISIPIRADGTGLAEEVAIKDREAQAGQHIDVPIRVSSSGGAGSADAEGAKVGQSFARAILREAGRVVIGAAVLQLIPAAISGLDALAGAAGSAAAELGNLAGVAATVPQFLGAIAQSATVAVLALGGVVGALKTFAQSQKTIGAAALGGASGDSAARAAETSARAIRDATRGIADAQRSAADSIESATERVTSALKAQTKAQLDLEDVNVSGAERIAAAIKTEARARQDLTDTIEASARKVQAAEDSLAHAQRNTQDAQEALTKARLDAQQGVDDLRASVERLSLTEDQARQRLAQIQAKTALERKRASQDLTGTTEATLRALERQAAAEDKALANSPEKAALDLRDAQLNLTEATKKRTDAESKLADAQAVGIDGNDKVVAAARRLSDAQDAEAKSAADNALVHRDAARAVVDATEKVTQAQLDLGKTQREVARSITDANDRVVQSNLDVVKAQRDLVRAQEDGARRIALAQEHLADAISEAALRGASAGGAAASAANRYQAALDALNPSARAFVEHLVELLPKYRALQAVAADGFLPGLSQAIDKVIPLIDHLTPIIDLTARAMGGLAVETANLVSSPAWKADLFRLGLSNIRVIQSLGAGALYAASGLRNITIAAIPLTEHVASLVENLAKAADGALSIGRDSGGLEAFFRRVGDRLDRLLITLGLFTGGLINVFKAALPQGDVYFGLLERIAAKFDIITERALKSGTLGKFFSDSQPALHEIVGLLGDLAKGLLAIGQANLGSFTAFVSQLRTELLPALLKIVGSIDPQFLSSLVTLATNLTTLIGTLLTGTPVFTILITFLGAFTKAVTTLLSDIPVLSPLLLGLVTVLGALGTVAALVKLEQFVSQLQGALAATELLNGAFGRFGTTVAVSAAEAQAAAVAVERAAAQEAAAVAAGFEAVEAKQGLVVGAISLVGKALLGLAVAFAVKQVIDQIAPSIDKLVRSVQASQDPLKTFEEGLNKLNHPGLFDKLLLAAKDVFSVSGVVKALKQDFSLAGAQGVKFGADSETAFRKLADASTSAAARVIAEATAQGKGTLAYQRILEDVIQTKAKQGVAEDDVSKRIAAATATLQGQNAELDRHAAKLRESTTRLLDMSGNALNSRDAMQRLTDAVVTNGNNFDINTAKGRENLRARNDLISSLDREVQGLIETAKKGHLDVAAKDDLIGRLQQLSHSEYPEVANQAKGFLDQLNAIPPQVDATINLHTEEAQAAIAELSRLWKLAKSDAEFAVEAFGAANAARITQQLSQDTGNLIPRAAGGIVQRNRAYVVGERRAELFIPNQDGIILPDVPPMSVPQQINQLDTTQGTSSFDMDRLVKALDDLEATLAKNLDAKVFDPPPPAPAPPVAPQRTLEDALAQAQRQADDAIAQARAAVQTVQQITGPLVSIEATFGPGSSAADIIEAMRAIARDEAADALAKVLAARSAGAGTRTTP